MTFRLGIVPGHLKLPKPVDFKIDFPTPRDSTLHGLCRQLGSAQSWEALSQRHTKRLPGSVKCRTIHAACAFRPGSEDDGD